MNAADFNLLAALTLGFLGSSHCLAMCGGISSALGMGTEGSSKPLILAGFNLGRIISYGIAGLLLGGLLELGSSQVQEVLQPMRWLAGGLLIAMGFYVAGWWMGLSYLEKLSMPLWRKLQPHTVRLMPVTSTGNALLLGGLWGWLPCGMVYSTLAWAATSGSAINTALAMMIFGLGTAPAMLAMGAAGASINKLKQARWFRSIAGIALIVFGVWTVLYAAPGGHQHQSTQPNSQQEHHRH